MSSVSGAKYEAELPPDGTKPSKDPAPADQVHPEPAGADQVRPDQVRPDQGRDKSSAADASPAVSSAAARDRQRETALLMKARGGDRSAYGQIIVLYQDRLFNALLRMVGQAEEARELAQETFVRGLEKIDTFRGEASPYTWLFRIGMNLAISNLRRSQHVRMFSLDGGGYRGNGRAHPHDQASALMDRLVSHRDDSPALAAEKNEIHQLVLDALGRIDAEYRAVLVMRDIEGFDYQQMADVLSLPLGTLKSRLFRARLALKDELGPKLADRKARGKNK